ncbi:hypothetical protein LVJ94_03695 [Pendulispora rubella]|uniref:Uncharacterized protein n=1 Tax=Pendulispora rubella TaxID=2741070 RepID=A0ABZ2L5Z0_9BACT
MILDIGKKVRFQFRVAGAVAVGFGIASTYPGITGEGVDDGGMGVRIGLTLFGLFLLGLGLLSLLVPIRRRRLILDQAGIRWEEPQGRSWTVAWPELAAVAVLCTAKGPAGPRTLTDIPGEAIVDGVVGEHVLVHLDLYPADPTFRARHPEMEHLWEFRRMKNGYRLSLAYTSAFVPKIDLAMRVFRPVIYRGVFDGG